MQLVYVHFPLHPETPLEGRALLDLFSGREAHLQAMMQRLDEVFRQEELPWLGSGRTMTYNSRLAQEVAAWAVTQPGGEGIHQALFEAYFVLGKNIGDTDILLSIAEKVGLSTDEAQSVIEQRSFRGRVDQDWQRCRRLGLHGVPAYVFEDKVMVGAQPYVELERLVIGTSA